jgi:uncharacterized protein (TIGR00251 family)
MFYEMDEDRVRLRLKAQPGAGRSEFCGLYTEDMLKVRIAAAAVDGAANKELIKIISKTFKVPKSSIEFLSGQNSKIKRVEFPKTEKFMEFIEKMKERK